MLLRDISGDVSSALRTSLACIGACAMEPRVFVAPFSQIFHRVQPLRWSSERRLLTRRAFVHVNENLRSCHSQTREKPVSRSCGARATNEGQLGARDAATRVDFCENDKVASSSSTPQWQTVTRKRKLSSHYSLKISANSRRRNTQLLKPFVRCASGGTTGGGPGTLGTLWFTGAHQAGRDECNVPRYDRDAVRFGCVAGSRARVIGVFICFVFCGSPKLR